MATTTNDSFDESMIPMPAPIPQDLVAPTKKSRIICGDIATGKTQELINAVRSLLAEGTMPEQIVVFCATPTATRCFQARLAQGDEAAQKVRVTTTRQLAQELLGIQEFAEATKRGNRLLAPFEMDFLLEDLKTSGVRPGRLKEMLRFFYKSLTELCDWSEEEWLLTGEENMVWDVLQECLAAYGAILEPELVNTVARHLHENASAGKKHGVSHVLVDDYQQLNRASQVFANELAQESITITCNPALSIEVFDSYPYGAGVEEFKIANPTADEVILESSFACAKAKQCHNGLIGTEFMGGEPFAISDQGDQKLEIELLDSPAEECQVVARQVELALAAGSNPQDVIVVTPHKIWEANIVAALQRSGIAAQTINDGSACRGDLRDLKKSEAARALTALLLVAEPTNALTWRVWCGFGDHFANSSALAAIRQWACEQNMLFDQALEAYYATQDSIAQNVTEHTRVQTAVQAGRDLIQQAQGKTGEDLLVFLTQAVLGQEALVPPAVKKLVAPVWGSEPCNDNSAAGILAKRARCRMDFPGVDSAEGVKLLPLNQVTGVTPKDLVLCGFVNGFIPSRGVLDREIMTQEEADKQTVKDLSLLMNALAKPTNSLVVTGFKELPLENAERLKLRIHRIQLKDGRRMAVVEPSLYSAYLS